MDVANASYNMHTHGEFKVFEIVSYIWGVRCWGVSLGAVPLYHQLAPAYTGIIYWVAIYSL